MPDLSTLGQYGLIGVMLALIALTASAIWILYKIASNHINHNTDAAIKQTEALQKLSTLIEMKL